MSDKNNFFFININNGYTGSVNVLKNVINQINVDKDKIHLISSFNNEGFLNCLNTINKVNFFYKFHRFKIFTLFYFIYFQLRCIIYLIKKSKKNDTLYLNTFHPFLVAIFGFLCNRKIIFHIHECFAKLNLFQRFLFWVVRNFSHKILCVSNVVLNQVNSKKSLLLHNSLSKEFERKSKPLKKKSNNNILMISSLKSYKGIYQFYDIALNNPKLNFNLVISSNFKEIELAFEKYSKLNNLKIYPLQKNLHLFYKKNDLILCLTDYRIVVETFGLAILEAMCYGLPCIVPPKSGVTDLVINNYNGLIVEPFNSKKLSLSINKILNPKNYNSFKNNSLIRYKKFKSENFRKQLNELLGL